MKKLNLVLCLTTLNYLHADSIDFLNQGEWHLNNLKINLLANKSISESYVQSFFSFKSGDMVYASDLSAITKNLNKTGWFDSIDWAGTILEQGKFDLVLNATVCPKVEDFEFHGNKEFKAEDLIATMKSRVNEPLNQQRLQTDVLRLKKFYQTKGFNQVQIEAFSQTTKDNYAKIIVKIQEGLRYKIKDIKIKGAQAFPENTLLDLLHTKTWGIFSWFTKTGRYNEELLLQDIATLQEFYRNNGYLDIDINRNNVQFETNGEALRITFNITEGIRYTIRNISLTTDIAEDQEALRKYIPLKSGDGAGAGAIDQAVESIRDFYGKHGYVDVKIKIQRILASENQLDVEFNVVRGLQYHINSIYLTGNIHTQARVILRELNLAPGDVLDYTRIKRAEQRLQNTGFFKSVLISPEECNSACEKNLKIAVEENKTGSIFFSGALNSVDKFTFGITLSQNNFDYKNSKDYYRGAGQKFQLATSIGKNSNSIDLSFEEPWLFDRELRFGFNLFRTMNKYSGDDYKEQRLGGEFYLGKRLFEQVEGKLYYRIEQFKLTGVANDVSQVIKDEQGSRVTSKVGLLLERDTRDQFIYPTKGMYLAWDNQVAGLGGKTKYFRTKATAARWFLVSSNHEQVFLIGGKAGMVRGFGGKQVPLFEREFLGGPDDLRGFDYHEVGPKSNDKYKENLGGTRFAFIKSEYSVKVNSIVRVVGFFDAGQVKEFSYTVKDPKSGCFCSDAGIGLRIHVMGAPFRLDFAFPLKTDAYNKKKAPNIAYSFGVSF